MRKVSVLLDGAFVKIKLSQRLGRRCRVADVVRFSKACLRKDEELFRIYYYDCPPFGDVVENPLSRETIDFRKTDTFIAMSSFQRDLSRCENVAFRNGVLSFVGWKLTSKAAKGLIENPREINEEDLEPDFKQKMVDMKIGLDIAWLSSNKIVERIILVTADSDFIPAMKFARREGIQVVLITMGHYSVRKEMFEHADFIRNVKYPIKKKAKK